MSQVIVEKGTAVNIKVVYTDTDTDQPTDPQTVTVKVLKPSGLIREDLVPTNPAVGTWVVTVPTDEEGTWYVRFFAASPDKVDTMAFDAVLTPDF